MLSMFKEINLRSVAKLDLWTNVTPKIHFWTTVSLFEQNLKVPPFPSLNICQTTTFFGSLKLKNEPFLVLSIAYLLI